MIKTGFDKDVAIYEEVLKNNWILSLDDKKLDSMKALSFKKRY